MSLESKRDAETTQKAILDAAESLFLDNGFGRTTISSVARQAGVTKSLIHHHFGSKKELWDEVKRRMLNVYFVAQKKMLTEHSDDLEILRESIIVYFRMLQSNPSFIRLLTWIFLEKDNKCYDLGEEVTELGIAKIKRAQVLGLIRQDLEPAHILFSFLALAEHWFLSKDQHMGNTICQISPDHSGVHSDDAFLEDMLKIFFQGILPPGKNV